LPCRAARSFATVATSAIPSIPPQQARVWFYRDLQPSGLPDVPYVRLNGAIAGTAYQGEAFYRDIPPGNYHVTVDSMVKDVNQSVDISLSGGQDAYIKVEQLDNWNQDEGEPTFATFYARLMPLAIGRPEVQGSHFHGGGSLTAVP
jgi:hypothetical protein